MSFQFNCFKFLVTVYEHIPKVCVNHHNLIRYQNTSIEDCKIKCNERKDCLSFEYGVQYSSKGAYKAKDCQLGDSTNSQGCNGIQHNLDLYFKIGIDQYNDDFSFPTLYYRFFM